MTRYKYCYMCVYADFIGEYDRVLCRQLVAVVPYDMPACKRFKKRR